MIAIVLLALGLLLLPSCQWQPEPPELQPEPLNVEQPEVGPGSAPGIPKSRRQAPKTARQYVREGYRWLLIGNEREARQALQAALRQEPQQRQAAMLLRQIEADPVAVFGSESWDYRIQPKDTLTVLAQRFLDDPLKFYLLAKYNRLSNPSRIIAGQRIKIPGKPSILQEPLVASKPTPITPAVAETSLSVESPSTQTHQEEPQATKTAAERPATIAASPHESGADASSGRYYAVVIGIEAYEHLSHLDTAVTDAMAMTQVLEKRYGFDVILLTDATRADILKILRRLRAILTSQDHLLIYYAGHGRRDQDGQGYWLPQDATTATPTTWLATSEITKTISLMAARHVMVIADSCYADIQAHNEATNSPSMEEARQANIERFETRRSRTVLTSGGLKPVLDPLGGPLSVFAKALLTVLYTNDERLEGQQLFDQMRPWMIASSSQAPAYAVIRHSGHEGGDFMLVPRLQH